MSRPVCVGIGAHAHDHVCRNDIHVSVHGDSHPYKKHISSLRCPCT